MGREWSTTVAAIRYYQLEGFIVARAECLQCENKWTAIIDPDKESATECPMCKCTKMKSLIVCPDITT